MKAVAPLLGVAVVVVALAWQLPGVYRAVPFLAPDSSTYLAWDAMRPAAYPLTLAVVRAVSADLEWLGPVQLLVFLSSAIWLAITFRRTCGHAFAAFVLAASIMLHPQVVSYAFTVLPESLLMSMVMLHAGAVMRLLSQRTLAWAGASGVTLAVAILTKPAAASLAGGFIVLTVALWRDRRRIQLLAATAAGVLLPVLAASAVNYARIGLFSPQAIGGFAMLGVTGTFMADETPVDPPTLGQALVARVRPLRDELARIASLETYYFFSSNAYHESLERSRAVLLEYVRATDPTAGDQLAFLRLNQIGGRVARASIRTSPRAYARHIAAHLYGLWLMPLVQNAANRVEFERSLSDARARMPELGRGAVMYRLVPAFVYWPFKGLLWSALIGSIVAISMWAVRPQSLRWTVAAHAAVLLHGYFLLTALAQTGLPRYALTAWPLTMLVVCSVAAALWLDEWRKNRAIAPGV